MSKLKLILAKIAQIPDADQRWILNQLSKKERDTFHHANGQQLLVEAQQFKHLPIPDVVTNPINKIPEIGQRLANQTPLYSAIILEQGVYPWRNQFLKQFDNDKSISTLLDNEVLDIKPIIKTAIFNDWLDSISFEDQLRDANHG